jgi:hypothetical protein
MTSSVTRRSNLALCHHHEGAIPIRYACAHPQTKELPEPEHAKASAQGSGASPSLRLPISKEPELNPWLLPGL